DTPVEVLVAVKFCDVVEISAPRKIVGGDVVGHRGDEAVRPPVIPVDLVGTVQHDRPFGARRVRGVQPELRRGNTGHDHRREQRRQHEAYHESFHRAALTNFMSYTTEPSIPANRHVRPRSSDAYNPDSTVATMRLPGCSRSKITSYKHGGGFSGGLVTTVSAEHAGRLPTLRTHDSPPSVETMTPVSNPTAAIRDPLAGSMATA